MSLKPATSCKEGVWQYCNYGYDKTLYSSYEDCMSKKMQECPTDEFEVICNDGTKDVSNGVVAPCLNHGGEKHGTGLLIANKDLTSTQKWGLVVGLTLVAYFILYKAGSLK